MGNKLVMFAMGAALLRLDVSAEVPHSHLRRKRTRSAGYTSGSQAGTPSQPRMSEELTQKYFMPDNTDLDDIDIRKLIMEMNIGSMSIEPIITPRPTPKPSPMPSGRPTASPTVSIAPTASDCDNPATCRNRLREQIYAISVRVGSVPTLDDPNSPQSRASDWILEECNLGAINYCSESEMLLNEQRYALAVMYFSLGGDDWNDGANLGQIRDSPAGTWLSGSNYCDWGAEVSGGTGGISYKQLVCDEFGNVLNLNLQTNNMVGEIPPEIGVLVYMTSYISFFNAQTGEIPSSLGLITPLQTFDVESNNMEGELFKPEYAGPNGLTDIENWRVSLNNFVGSVPSEIGRWTKIQNLWFADNGITGIIPSEIGSLENMGAFLFYKNQVMGTLPAEIGNMNVLTWIDMEDNNIVGTIPESFYTNLDLEEVILKNNKLAGGISSSIGDLTRLARFWASFNLMSGTIPTQVGNLVNLEELELQNNKLTGPLPSEMGNMNSIEFLSAELNTLTGTIPPELFSPQLGGLRILYLNNNELNGPIPDNYGLATRLKDLWLFNNQLTGTLPLISEGEFLFLEELLLNDNDLTGVVDESLCLIRNDTGKGNLGVFHTDCQPPPDGGAPQIQCSCCTACYV